MAGLKTGKLPARHDERDLRFADYVELGTVLPKVPRMFGHEKAVPEWGMLGNGPDPEMGPAFTGAGDCVWAGAAHETMLWTSESGAGEAVFSTHGVLDDYAAVTGYTPTDPDTDRGTEVRAALNFRRRTGIVDARGTRHRLGAYVALQPGNIDHIHAALYLFGAVGLGIRFPASAMAQFEAHMPWTVVEAAEIDGGHYIPLVARRADKLDCVSWARIQPMTASFLQTYCDEAYALLSPEMLNASGRSPEGFDLHQLTRDLAAVSEG
jgi:hypothetical protein